MNKEFISYTESLELKQLGFDKPCFGYWYTEQEKFKKIDIQLSSIGFLEGEPDYILAPTFSQAFRFFREEYRLQHNIVWNKFYPDCPYQWEVRKQWTNEYSIPYGHGGMANTYENAELECIKQIINLLKDDKRVN
jgi:hypothetical protein